MHDPRRANGPTEQHDWSTVSLPAADRGCQEPPATNLPGRQRGQPEEGPLSAEVDVAELLECRPQRQAGNFSRTGAKARQAWTRWSLRPTTPGQDGLFTSQPSNIGVRDRSVVCTSRKQAASFGHWNSDGSRPLPSGNGQECVGTGMGSPIRVAPATAFVRRSCQDAMVKVYHLARTNISRSG